MGLGKKTIDDQNYCGKKVLVRCDFNVPMKDGVITNENRINAALPTIQKLVNDGAKVILCSHLGKPKNGPEAKFSLAPVAVALSAKLGKTVVFADCYLFGVVGGSRRHYPYIVLLDEHLKRLVHT